MLAFCLAASIATTSAGSSRANQDEVVAAPGYRQADDVAIIEIHGPIDSLTRDSILRRFKAAKEDGADAIVLEIDTPGGDVMSTLDICHWIKTEAPLNTVAWIRPKAYSAGTIIALACREIVVSPNAVFGDAAPIQGIPVVGLIQMSPAERAKIETPLLSEVVDSARRNRYDEQLVQSFISVDRELWLLKNKRTGKLILVDSSEYEDVMENEPPRQERAQRQSMQTMENSGVMPMLEKMLGQGEGLPEEVMTPEQQKEMIEYYQTLPSTRSRLDSSERGNWELVSPVVSANELLVLRENEALALGLARDSIANETELGNYFASRTVARYSENWSEGLVRFLASWPVRIVLVIVMIICLLVELTAPGMGAFGAGGLVALAILLGAPYLVGMAEWWEILLIFLGLALVAVELFLIPGFGVAGIGGMICLVIGVIGTFVLNDLGSPQGQAELATGIGAILAGLFTTFVVLWFLSRYSRSIPGMDKLVLDARVDSRDPAMTAALAGSGTPMNGHEPEIGAEGIAVTDLKRSGKAEFNGSIMGVQSTSAFIDKGTRIRVVGIQDNNIEVERIDA